MYQNKSQFGYDLFLLLIVIKTSKYGRSRIVSFMHEHGWLLFLISEGLTWLFIGLFFYCRYWLKFDRLSQVLLIVIIMINIFQIFLGCIDYYVTGEISFFQIVIVLFITYASTLGNADFKRLDQFIKKKINKYRMYIDQDEELEALQSHIPYRMGLFFTHTIAFGFIHYIWFLFERDWFNSMIDFNLFIVRTWFQSIDPTFFTSSIYIMTSYVWSIIYLFDLFVFLVYFLIWKCWKIEGLSQE